MPFENKFLHIHQWEPTLAGIWSIYWVYFCIQALRSPAKTAFCLWRKTLASGQSPPFPETTGLCSMLSGTEIFILISLHKHFHTWIKPPGFVERSKLKQKGRENTMLSSVRGMEKPYWTVITKTDVCHSTEGYIQTVIKTSSVRYKGQYLIQY